MHLSPRSLLVALSLLCAMLGVVFAVGDEEVASGAERVGDMTAAPPLAVVADVHGSIRTSTAAARATSAPRTPAPVATERATEAPSPTVTVGATPAPRPSPTPTATPQPAATPDPTATSTSMPVPLATSAPLPTQVLAPVAPPTATAVLADEVLGVAVVNTATDAASRGARVLSQMGIGPSFVGFTMSFHPPLPGYLGLTHPDERHIQIFVDPAASDATLRYIIAHELGHAVDIALITDADEAAWRNARGIASTISWWPTPYANDFGSPAGDFAECFAAYLTGSVSRSALGSCAGTSVLIEQVLRR